MASPNLPERADPKDRRRSPRISRVVPLTLSHAERSFPAEAIVINAHGALVESPYPLYAGANLDLSNRRTRESTTAWVIRSVPSDTPDRHHLAIEFLSPSPQFWGPDYSP